MRNKDFLQNIEIINTADGSKTIYNPQIGENYHSKHGALQESQHVFVNAGLKHYHQLTQKNEISILEIGFGTGLNFLLSADYAIKEHLNIQYTGIEAYPLLFETIENTGYKNFVENSVLYDRFATMYKDCFQNIQKITEDVHFEIKETELLSYETLKKFDIIYFDAFAKVHQAEMWNEQSIKHACKFLKDKGIFVTYSVTGDLRRQLKALGFSIERPQGAAGKREMMRATLSYDL
jgi:tRNA U34 5-methylaminomethyl-2-thiouridine-forming methyltransferase MnmC